MKNTLFGSIAVLAFAAMVHAEDAAPKPLPPAEAKNHVGKKITVELEVKTAKKSGKFKRVFLDSMNNFQDPDNLGVAITENAEAALATKFAVGDVPAFFMGKWIRVTGTIDRREERTYLDVDDAGQIEVIDKK